MSNNNETKNCQNCKKDFVIEQDDFNFYEMMKVPAPTFCPECRLIRRLAWRNDRYLTKVNCQLCGKSTFSTFEQDSGYTLYCPDCWTGDDWDRSKYGQEYDFSKPFFEQMRELLKKVPLQARNVITSTLKNSDYTNYVGNLKNCYLIYNSDYDENCMYGTDIEKSKDCVDNTMIDVCEQAYGNVNCQKCSKIFYSSDCIESSDVWFSCDLVGCMNCFGCVGLRNKNYYIFNQPLSREKYQEEIKNIFSGKHSEIDSIEEKVRKIYLTIPRRYMHGRQNVSVSGEYIYHSKEVKNSYSITEARNCKYCMWLIAPTSKDCWDYIEYGDNAEQMYETATAGINVSKVKFSHIILKDSTDVEYSYFCSNVKNVFGCVSLKKKNFCILNKEYTKEQYEELLPKIKQHMNDMPYVDKKGRVYKYGEFFPFDLSPYPYNKTTAQEFFPIKEEDADSLGYRWEDISEKNYSPTIFSENLPDTISEVSDSFVNEIIGCEEAQNKESKMWNCTKAFRVTQNELNFYKKHSIPLPRKCPNCRHHDRIQKRNLPTLWHRKCMNKGCNNEFETPYAPDRPEIVYCESCYQKEIY